MQTSIPTSTSVFLRQPRSPASPRSTLFRPSTRWFLNGVVHSLRRSWRGQNFSRSASRPAPGIFIGKVLTPPLPALPGDLSARLSCHGASAMPLRGSLMGESARPYVWDALGRSRRPTADRRSFLLNRRSARPAPRVQPGSPAPQAHLTAISMHRTVAFDLL